jgi:hypothetical protein
MPHQDILLALSTARSLAAIILGRPATDDSEAVEVYRRWQQMTPSLTRFPLRQMLVSCLTLLFSAKSDSLSAMNHLVTLVQPLNVAFAPLRPASGNSPPLLPTSTNEGGEEDDNVDDDDDDDDDDNDRGT